MKLKEFSWADIEDMSGELAAKIKASGFEPDYLLGIAVAGLVPLCLLAKKLNIKNVLTVSANSYEKDKQGELEITYLPDVDLEGKDLLLVDEIADTGRTLEKIHSEVLKKYKPKSLHTATLVVNKNRCKFLPDFFVREEAVDWVLFPWDRDETPELFG